MVNKSLQDDVKHLKSLSHRGWWDDGKRPGASVLPSKFSGGGFWGGNTVGWWDSFPPFWFSGGSKTTKEVFRMVPRHVSDSPRRTQDGPRRRQDSQDGSKALLRRPKTDPKSTKIHGKLMLRAIPISVSFFVRFLIDFQSIFRPQKFDFLLELYRFYSSFGLSGFIRIKWILRCIFEPTWFGF